MKSRSTSLILAAAGSLALSPLAFGYGDPGDFVIPTTTPYVQYGDAQSYALQVYCDVGGLTKNACPFAIQSSDGQIMNLINPANDTGNNGVINNFTNQDNAYATPSGTPQNPANPFFRPVDSGTVQGVPANYQGTNGTIVNPNGGMSPIGVGCTLGAPPGNSFTGGNCAATWDSSVSALKTYLNGTPGSAGMVFFFNNNQTGAGGQTFTSQENLAAWAKVWITDANDNVVGQVYYLTNQGQNGNAGTLSGGLYQPTYPGAPFGGGQPNGLVTQFTGPQDVNQNPGASGSNTDYILSGGPICTKAGVVVDCAGPGPFDTTTDNNLGSDQAAYAVVFPELNTILAGLFANGLLDLTQYTFHMDVRLGCDPALFDQATTQCDGKRLDNGGEKIFIGALAAPGTPPFNVPEPATLALIGFGLLGIAVVGRSYRRRG